MLQWCELRRLRMNKRDARDVEKKQKRNGKSRKGIWFTPWHLRLCLPLHVYFVFSCKFAKEASLIMLLINKWRDPPLKKVGSGGESTWMNLKFIVWLVEAKTCLFLYEIVKQDILRCAGVLRDTSSQPFMLSIDYAISFVRLSEQSSGIERELYRNLWHLKVQKVSKWWN